RRAPDGTIVLGTETGMEAFAWPGGEGAALWATLPGPPAPPLSRAWIVNDRVLAVDDGAAMAVRRAADGAVHVIEEAVPLRGRLPVRLSSVAVDDLGVVLLFEDRVVTVGGDGMISGMDAIS